MPPTCTFKEFPAFVDSLNRQLTRNDNNNNNNNDDDDDDDDDGDDTSGGGILRDTTVAMYCTGGVRCERASAYVRQAHGAVPGLEVVQLEGGIHRYLEAFPEDGGLWVGKNYTFDKRFSHGACQTETIAECVVCRAPWERYQAQLKCNKCKMEVIVCKTCTRNKKAKPIPKSALVCPLCDPALKSRSDAATAKAAEVHSSRVMAAACSGAGGDGSAAGSSDR